MNASRLGAAKHVIVERPVYPCAIAWSPSGTMLALGGDDGSVELLSADGAHVLSLRAHAGPVQSLAWHPQRDDLVTTGQDGSVRLWRAPYEGARVLVEPGPTWVDLASWSPDGRRVAVAVGARALVIEVDGPTTACDAVESSITGLAFSPSGKSLAAACYGGVRLFDPATGARTRKLDWKGSMVSLAFSPSGSIVACGCQDHSVHFWRIASGKDAQMSGYPAKPSAIGFTHDGGWLATGGDSTISMWPFDKRGPEGRTPLQLAAHEDLVTCLACAPHVDLVVSGDRSGVVALWAPPQRKVPVAVAKLSARVVHVAWGADASAGTLRYAAADGAGCVMLGAL